MRELASYSLSDFILFSESVYYRQFELYNQAIWPLHLLAILFVLLIFLAQRNNSVWAGRLIAFLLVMSWVWVAVAFLYLRFNQIHVVANWYAYGFLVQACFIAWYGLLHNGFGVLARSRIRTGLGWILLWLSLVFYPLIAVVSGRHWLQFEMFAIAPDPTVVATLAILLMRKVNWVLFIMPVMWILISFTTLLVMA